MWLVAGLGNPGPEYEHTRHNIGFMVADELSRRWSMGSWKNKFGGEVTQKDQIVILKPQQYMNVSSSMAAGLAFGSTFSSTLTV